MTKKEKLLNQSLKLIHQKGFKATTIRDIAESMNCDVANIYNFIDSKQGLLESHLFSINEEFHLRFDEIIKSSFRPLDKIKRLVVIYIDLTISKPYQASLLVNEWRHLKEPKLSQFIKEREKFELKVKKLIKQGKKDGSFREIDVNIATYTLLSSVRWLFDKVAKGDIKVNRVEVEKQLLDFVLCGLTV